MVVCLKDKEGKDKKGEFFQTLELVSRDLELFLQNECGTECVFDEKKETNPCPCWLSVWCFYCSANINHSWKGLRG